MKPRRTFSMIALLLAVFAPVADAQTGLTGVVREDSTGRPIADAEVVIEALKRSTRTDAAGKYTLGDLSAGVRMVTIRRVGYQPSGFMVQLVDRELKSKDFTIERSTPALDTLRVHATAGALGVALAKFNDRRDRGFGVFFDSTALKGRENSNLSDILAGVMGVNLIKPPLCYPPPARRSDPYYHVTNCVSSPRVRVAMGRGLCAMQILLDGNLVSRGGPLSDTEPSASHFHDWTTAFDVTSLTAGTLVTIEVYRRQDEIPADLRSDGQECGVIVAWTRR